MQHFKIHELVDRAHFDQFGEKCWDYFNPNFLQALDDLVDFFSDLANDYCPVVVNNWHSGGPYQLRGMRTLAQAVQQGAPHSEHRYDPDPNNTHLVNAADCTIGKYSAEEARRIIKSHQEHALLNRIMRLEGKVSWNHIDCKPIENRIYIFTA